MCQLDISKYYCCANVIAWVFLVSSAACKDFRTCHSILPTSKKAKQTKKSTILLGPIREGRTQGRLVPPRGETSKYKESSLTRTDLQIDISAGTRARLGKLGLQLTND